MVHTGYFNRVLFVLFLTVGAFCSSVDCSEKIALAGDLPLFIQRSAIPVQKKPVSRRNLRIGKKLVTKRINKKAKVESAHLKSNEMKKSGEFKGDLRDLPKKHPIERERSQLPDPLVKPKVRPTPKFEPNR